MKYIPSGSGRIVEKPDYTKQIIFEQNDFDSTGHLLQIVSNLAGKTLKAHYHTKQTEVCYILSGYSTWTINGNRFDVKPGDAIIMEPNDIHEIVNTRDTDCRVLVFKIDLPRDDSDFYSAIQ